MGLLSQALVRMELIVAGLTLAVAAKSAYNGHVRGLVDNIYTIESLEQKVDHIEERQDEMIDGIVAVSIAESEENYSVDADRLAEQLNEGSYRSYLERDGRSPYPDVEDEELEVSEEEPRWRQEYDD